MRAFSPIKQADISLLIRSLALREISQNIVLTQSGGQTVLKVDKNQMKY